MGADTNSATNLMNLNSIRQPQYVLINLDTKIGDLEVENGTVNIKDAK